MVTITRFACWLSLASAFGAAQEHPPSPDATVGVSIIDQEGRPVPGAKVWTVVWSNTGEASDFGSAVTTNDTGIARPALPTVTSNRPVPLSFVAEAPDGRIGGLNYVTNRRLEIPRDPNVIRLLPVRQRSGTLVDDGGKPLANVEIVPIGSLVETPQRFAGNRPSLPIPPARQVQLTTRTDALGRFTLPPLPSNQRVLIDARAQGRGQVRFAVAATATGDVQLTFPKLVPMTVKVEGVESAMLKGSSLTIMEQPRSLSDEPSRRSSAVFASTKVPLDGRSETIVPALIPGLYRLSPMLDPQTPMVIDREIPFAVKAEGRNVVTVKVCPAVTVTGKIVTEDGRGVAGVEVRGISQNSANGGRDTFITVSNALGEFTVHGDPGWYQLNYLDQIPKDLAKPITAPARSLGPPVRAELNQPGVIAPVVLVRAREFRARVVDAAGRPVTGALVRLPMFDPLPLRPQRVTDADGLVVVQGLSPELVLSPRVKLGNAVNRPTLLPVKDLDPTKPVMATITIAPENAAVLEGRVVDSLAKPVAGAKVELYERIEGFGPFTPRASQQGTTDVALTDQAGRFRFVGLHDGDSYRPLITAADASPAGNFEFQKAVAGQVMTVPDQVVLVSQRTLSGLVVDTGGRPVPDVQVLSVDGTAPALTQTGVDGRFTLEGLYSTPGFLFAEKPGFQRVSEPFGGEAGGDVRIVLPRADEPPRPLSVPDEVVAARRELAKHIVTRIHQRQLTNGGGMEAVQLMAKWDPALARGWADEEFKRSNGQVDWRPLVAAEERHRTLMGTAMKDVAAALKSLEGVTGTSGFLEVLDLGERLLASDAGRAARVAEEAVVRARGLESPRRITALAMAGDLLARAGDVAAGRKLIEEAATLAEALPPGNSWDQVGAWGVVAVRLAAFDEPRARALLGRLTEPSTFNHFLASVCSRVAAVDAPRAIQLLNECRVDEQREVQKARVLVALQIARKDLGQALRLLDTAAWDETRFLAYVQIASALAPVDRGRASELFGRAFDLVSAERSSTSRRLTQAAEYATLAVLHAQRAGMPDVAEMIARALQSRPPERQDFSLDHPIAMAAGLSLVDVATARRVLATIAPFGPFEPGKSRVGFTWLCASALCDPASARALCDAWLDQAQPGRLIGGVNVNVETSAMLRIARLLGAADPFIELPATMLGLFARTFEENDGRTLFIDRPARRPDR